MTPSESRKPETSTPATALRAVKLIHTAVWVFFVACIAAIPVFTALGRFGLAWLFVGVVGLEVAVLVVNRMRCPLTDVAARYTEDRRANFDIYLPEWLARHNKTIFGTIYCLAIVCLVIAWIQQ